MNNHDNYDLECKVINMRAIPYFGVYSPDYTFMDPINIIHKSKINEELRSTFPNKLNYCLNQYIHNYKTPIEYFHITYDASYMCHKYNNDILRINAVLHPYIFQNVKDYNNHKTIAFISIYRKNEFQILNDSMENDGLRIDPDCFICEDNKKQIHLHSCDDQIAAISPNNCAFIIDTRETLSSFYVVCGVHFGNKITKLMICEAVIVNNHDILLFSNILESLFIYSNSDKSDTSKLTLSNSLNTFKMIFKNISKYISNIYIDRLNDNQTQEIMNKIFMILFMNTNNLYYNTNYYYNYLCNFLWRKFDCPNITNFGEKILLYDYQDENNFIAHCLTNFIGNLSNTYIAIIDQYLFLLNQPINIDINNLQIYFKIYSEEIKAKTGNEYSIDYKPKLKKNETIWLAMKLNLVLDKIISVIIY